VINWPTFVSQLFNGLVLGALLALISSGLTIIYGTLGVLNLAHGAMFMLGGYAGWLAYRQTNSFIIAVLAGSIFVMLGGVVMERLIIRHFYSRPHEDQLLVTFGLGIVFVEAVRFFFGSLSKAVSAPAGLVGITPLGFMFYPTYRLALLGIVVVALIALYLVLYRTRIGMVVRAGIEDSAMVDALGIVGVLLGPFGEVGKLLTQYAQAAGTTHFVRVLFAQLVVEGSNLAHGCERLFVAVAYRVEKDFARPGRTASDHQGGKWRLRPLAAGIGKIGGVCGVGRREACGQTSGRISDVELQR
jgi:hypothetical protein